MQATDVARDRANPRRPFAPKRAEDGKMLLNVACGARSHPAWNNVDFSPYTRLARRPWAARLLHRAGLLSDVRYDRVRRVDPDIVSWDLRNGIPFADDTFDVVYHSHFLEHLERSVAPKFMRECFRVLKPEGMIRVVVPDLELLIGRYLSSLAAFRRRQDDALRLHGAALHELFDQMVRTESTGATQQKAWVRRIERIFRTAANTGELHMWMYDQYSLAALLQETGFRDPIVREHSTSAYPGWQEFALDTEPDGTPYKPYSLYMEAFK